MKPSWHLILTVILVFGVSATAHGKKDQKKKTYRLEACDCIGIKDEIPTFLSDLIGEHSIEVESTSLRKAEEKANRMCFEDYRQIAAVKAEDVSSTGCKAFESAGEFGKWKSI